MVSAEMVCPYPPGIPIICPGEKLTEEVVDALHNISLSGTAVTGPEDPTLNTIGIIANSLDAWIGFIFSSLIYIKS